MFKTCKTVTNLHRKKIFIRWNICVIVVLIVIGTRAMIHFMSTSQVPSTTSNNFCTKTRGPSVYIICTWDVKEDRIISAKIHSIGKWEPAVTRKLYSVLKQDRNITFIDIGANIGYFSLLAASVGQSVISVEPWKLNIEKLQNSIRKNKFEGKITILNNAVSNNKWLIRIHAPRGHNKGRTRLLSDPTVNGSNVFSAESITFNDVANYIHTKDVVIKMDIEGNECRALEISDIIFEKFNVLFISMEWVVMKMYRHAPGTPCPTKHIERMLKMLAKRGFVPYGFPDSVSLNPVKYKYWTRNDIYWKPKTRHALT